MLLIEPVRLMLEMHRLKLGNPSAGVMFPTANGTPLCLHNVYEDYIKPELRRCVHCGATEAHHASFEHDYEQNPSLHQWHG